MGGPKKSSALRGACKRSVCGFGENAASVGSVLESKFLNQSESIKETHKKTCKCKYNY